ncbi:putative sugar uptake protein [Levilactobacillus zymae]|uniref:Sugar uptake protein n=1 Tax=Levilactobacillus zymae TaxID=267363 RepID=A0ABQ0WWC6_9LACO|nr:GRP family sugar transporter [Levilactobacillus zymae]KRL13165.1 glucose uptake permease [Levilactobacillus zymae DSM 19395]QFR61179.1 glucose transporter GlcU [Levilactobacillus zymae]GEO72175.1 putative sugar uptake protein [Levilactobacillus zymae]
MAILFALIPALCWGSIGLISGRLGGTSYQQTLGMTAGAVLFGLFSLMYFHVHLTGFAMLVGIASGLCWAVGQFQQFQSMKFIGISRTVPISTGLQLAGTALAGVLLFHEWKTASMVTMGTIAVIVLIAGAALTSLRDKRQGVSSEPVEAGRGATAIAISTVGYVLYTVIVNLSGLDSKLILFPQSLGMILGALIFIVLSPQNRRKVWHTATAKNIITGLVWGIGNFFMFMAIPKVGLAISYSLAQCGIVISTFGSIWLLGEKKTGREMVYTTIGSLLVIAGGVTLGLMK